MARVAADDDPGRPVERLAEVSGEAGGGLVEVTVKGSGEVVAATPIGEDGVQVTIRITVQVRNQDKPGCVVETISRLFFIREN